MRAGTVDIVLNNEPLGLATRRAGVPQGHLADNEEVGARHRTHVKPESSPNVTPSSSPAMKPEQLKATRRAVPWDESSTYIKIHPSSKADPRTSASDDIHGARVQAWLADTVTTDQYSPAAPSGGHSGGQCLLDTALRCRIQLLRFAGRGNDRVLTAHRCQYPPQNALEPV